MAEQNREQIISDFKQWLDEHKEQVQAHTLDALPMEDFDDDWDDIWEGKSDGEINQSRYSRRI